MKKSGYVVDRGDIDPVFPPIRSPVFPVLDKVFLHEFIQVKRAMHRDVLVTKLVPEIRSKH